jgi:hypothetical protein
MVVAHDWSRIEIVPMSEIARGPTGKFEEFLSLVTTE